MLRSILNDFPEWLLALLFIGASWPSRSAPTSLVSRFLPDWRNRENLEGILAVGGTRATRSPRGRSRISAQAAERTIPRMDDDDDWVGEPPEGRYTRDRAKPEFWRGQRPPEIIAAVVVVAIIVLVVVLLLR